MNNSGKLFHQRVNSIELTLWRDSFRQRVSCQLYMNRVRAPRFASFDPSFRQISPLFSPVLRKIKNPSKNSNSSPLISPIWTNTRRHIYIFDHDCANVSQTRVSRNFTWPNLPDINNPRRVDCEGWSFPRYKRQQQQLWLWPAATWKISCGE